MKSTLLIALLGICSLGTFAQKYVGGDISLLPKYEEAKSQYYDKDENVCQDLAYIKPLAKRIKNAGFKLMFYFHYSDTWADSAKQWTPDDWKNFTDTEMTIKALQQAT